MCKQVNGVYGYMGSADIAFVVWTDSATESSLRADG
jgi:hypothetical protein